MPANATAPAINVIETDKEYKVEVAAPGMTREDFDIRLTDDNRLVVTMEKKEEKESAEPAGGESHPKEEKREWDRVDKALEKKGDRYLRREFSYSRFQQAMILPDNIERDRIAAKAENGVLNIVIPKSEPHKQSSRERRIEIG